MSLADDDNYRERRYFTAWTKLKQIEDHVLPDFIQKITDQVRDSKTLATKKDVINRNLILERGTVRRCGYSSAGRVNRKRNVRRTLVASLVSSLFSFINKKINKKIIF